MGKFPAALKPLTARPILKQFYDFCKRNLPFPAVFFARYEKSAIFRFSAIIRHSAITGLSQLPGFRNYLAFALSAIPAKPAFYKSKDRSAFREDLSALPFF